MPSDDEQKISARRQLGFHQLLVAARKTRLIDALQAALETVDPVLLKRQLGKSVPTDIQRLLAQAGIRDEQVFPCPALLEASPTLIGYYRLLLGISQKRFYTSGTGLGRFKNMEARGTMSAAQKAALPEFCTVMTAALADLVRQVSPSITPRDIQELPLLTLGAEFYGANNNEIGNQATSEVFLAITEIVAGYVTIRTERHISLLNSAGRKVTIRLAGDPDVAIEEDVSGQVLKKLAIEIKGGTDKSNAHNRAGEAEKSHQKAKQEGFPECWTIIAKRGLDMSRLEAESPTTNSWFDVSQVLAREGDDWKAFKERIAVMVGVPVNA